MSSRFSLTLPTALALTVLILAGSGCTKEARRDRHLSQGNGYMQSGDFAKARIEYLAALAVIPGDYAALGRLGVLFSNEGNMTGYSLLRRAIDGGVKDPEVQLAYGRAALSEARLRDARDAAKHVLESQPSNDEALLLLATASVSSADYENSRQLIDKLQAQNPDAPGFHLGRGTLLLGKRDFPGAEAEFKKALELDPKSSGAFGQLGLLAIMRGHPADARAPLKTASDLSKPWSPRRMLYVRELMQQGEAAEAKKELAAITSQAPDFLPAWDLVMKTAYSEHRYDDCSAAIQKILQGDPVNYDALLVRAKLMLAQGDTSGAIKEFQRLEKAFAPVPQFQLEYALARIQGGDNAGASESLRRAIQAAPNYDLAIVLLAELDLRKGEAAEAISLLGPVLKRQPGLPRANLALARAYQEQKAYEQSAAIFRQLAVQAPKDAGYPFFAGQALLAAGQLANARALFQQAVQIAPDDWAAWEMLVGLDVSEKRFGEATSMTESLIRKYPAASSPWLLHARMRLAQSDQPGAKDDLLKAIERDPTSQNAYILLTQIYFAMGQGQQAVDTLSRVPVEKRNVAVWMQLGMLQGALHHYDQARDAYERLLALEPKFEPALNNLASIYADNLGDLTKAYALAEKAREAAPDDPYAEDTFAWISFRRGDFEGSRPLLVEAAYKLPAVPEVPYHLAMANYMLGREDDARTAFQKAIAAAAESPVKADAQRRLRILEIDPAKAGPEVRADLESRTAKESDDPELRLRLAAIEARDGDAKAAAVQYESALKLNPRSPRTLDALAELYAGPAQNPARAQELAQSAHTLAPNDAGATRILGRLAYRAGNYKWSLALLQEAQRSLSGDADLAYDLARADAALGRLPEAEADLHPVLASDAPFATRSDAQRLETMLAAAQNPALAKAALPEAERMLASDPRDVAALMVSGLALEAQANYAGAAQTYEKILVTDPLFVRATRSLAILYADRLGDDKKALDLANKAREAFPEDNDLARTLGILAYRKPDYSEAARWLQDCVRKNDHDARAVFYLGMAHVQLKNVIGGKAELQKALDLTLPEEETGEAKKMLDRLNTE